MSNIYITEPSTSGKVIISTTVGDIEVELWSKETPLACRNFVQLCMEGYYDDTAFHRLVKGFIVQGGDPTGTGEGGESAFGAPFKTESHSRLLFNRRGLLGMACPEANSNGSQFFFTLAEASELNGKHTLFGRVVGNTIFNMLRLAEVEVISGDRPARLHRILKTTVVLNPYDDIVPRQLKSQKKNFVADEIKQATKGAKNYSLLSFGEEAEEDEEAVAKVEEQLRARGKSAHEISGDTRLSKETVAISHEEDAKVTMAATVAMEHEAEQRRRRRELAARLETEEDVLAKQKKMDDLRSEADAVRRDIARTLVATKQREANAAEAIRRVESKRADEAAEDLEQEQQLLQGAAVAGADEGSVGGESIKPMMDNFADEVASYRARAKKYKMRRNREEQTMNLLSRFESKLSGALHQKPVESGDSDTGDSKDAFETTARDPSLWLRCKLQSEEPTPARKVMDPALENADRHDLYDPRHPLNVRKRGAANSGTDNPHKYRKM